MELLRFLSEGVCGVITPLLLLSMGAFLTVYLKAFHLRHPIRCARLMLSGESKRSKRKSLKAFCMALGGTLGVGNIAGVALAVYLGGAGSLFWMWCSALLAMLLKYAEIWLSMKQIKETPHPMPHTSLGYIWAGTGCVSSVLSTLFCGATFLSAIFIGGMLQSNAVSEIFGSTYDTPAVFIAILLFVLTIVVIFGGGKRISAVTFALVPFATFLYIFLTAGVIWYFRANLPSVMVSIFKSAFSLRSAGGGILGYGMLRAMRLGCTRGLLSNEAGCGTAPMAHATSENASPERQGIWGIFEVFIDTILLCSLTGFAILLPTDMPLSGEGMAQVGRCLALVWGKAGEGLLAFSVLLFAFATIICWSYYGHIALSVFSLSPKVKRSYQALFSLAVFMGAILTPSFIWLITDILLAIMTTINLLAVFRHRKRVRASLEQLPFYS